LVVAAADDKLTPVKYGEYLAGAIAGARLLRLADAGHLVVVEKPEEINRAIADFLG
jgi:pimeloyl-ACP methyl ester carboxylesterase